MGIEVGGGWALLWWQWLPQAPLVGIGSHGTSVPAGQQGSAAEGELGAPVSGWWVGVPAHQGTLLSPGASIPSRV